MVREKNDGSEGYFLSKEEYQVTENVVNYFLGGETQLNRSKGLLVSGQIGTGKTMMMQIIQKIINDRLPWRDELRIAFNPCKEIVHGYNMPGNEGGDAHIDQFLKRKERIFDDLGAEKIGRFYAKDNEVMEEILESRYRFWLSTGIRTHVTTNLGDAEIESRYGKRLLTRFTQMFNIVIYPGTNKRELSDVNLPETVYFEKPKETSEEEKKRLNDEFLKNCFIDPYNRMKSIGVLGIDEHTREYFCNKFYEKKAFVITKEDRETYMKKAMLLVRDDWNMKKESDPKKYYDLINKLDKFEKENIKNEDVLRWVKLHATSFFFKDWIAKQIKENKTAEELLKIIE